jgi:hypothetical protein
LLILLCFHAAALFTGCGSPEGGPTGGGGGEGDLGGGGPNAETPVISGQPQGGVTYTVGGTSVVPLTVTASVSDGGTLSYQWYGNALNDTTTGSVISGETAAAYTPSTAAEGTLYYYVVVTNTLGSKRASTPSDTAEILVNNLVNAQVPNITSQPLGASYPRNASSPTALSVIASVSDSGTLSYQWYSDDDGDRSNGGEAAVGTNAPSYTPSAAAEGTLYYYVKVTNTISDNSDGGVKVQSLYSATVAITITVTHAGEPSISTQPQGASYTTGATAAALSVAVSVDGLTGTLSYQWYSNTSNDNTTGSPIGGQTNDSFTPPTDTEGTVYYYVEVTNAISDNGDGGTKSKSVTSGAAALIVSDQVNAAVPVISVQPADGTYIMNRPAVPLSVAASVGDGGVLSYQWYSNTGNNNTTGTSLGVGARGASYTPPTTAAGTLYYYVIVTNTISNNGDGGNKTASLASAPAEVTVMAAFTNLAGIAGYLSGVSGGVSDTDPVPLPVDMQLSAANWTNLLVAIKNGDKYVALDLSACIRGNHSYGGGLYTDGTFDPIKDDASIDRRLGKYRIVSFILPDAASGIAESYFDDPAFEYFANLKNVRGKNITSLDYSVFKSSTALTTVDFPGVLTVGQYAFMNCGLSTVNLPLAQTIGEDAFQGCRALRMISLPAAISIGDSAFGDCEALETVDLPVAKTIGEGAFCFVYGPSCIALTSVYFPEVESIGNAAFRQCTALESVDLPKVESIGDAAFRECTALETLNLPKVESVGASAFYYCIELNTVSLPGIKNIGNGAFLDCESLSTANIATATSIGNYAFEDTALQSVNAPAAVSIGYEAFKNCTSLQSANISSAETIGDSAFQGCTKLTTVDLSSVETIGASAFSGCIVLTLTTPVLSSAESVGGSAFGNCKALTTISLPAAESIGGSAFSGCTNLTTANIPAAESVGASAFQGCTKLTTVILSVATSIGWRAFYDCGALTTIDLSTVEDIGGGAFQGCGFLSTVNLSSAVTIGEYAFSSCTVLTLTTPLLSLVESVGKSAFLYCKALTEISLPVAASIGNNAFNGCTALLTANLPAAIDIGNYVFRDCTDLTTVDLSAAETIGEYAFEDCTDLTTVDLSSVESIGAVAFGGCRELTSLSLPADPPGLGSSVFYATVGGSSTTLTITVPPGSVSAYTAAPASGGWGVSADTAYNGNTAVYGHSHKRIVISATP